VGEDVVGKCGITVPLTRSAAGDRGYARCSTEEQDLTAQRDARLAAGPYAGLAPPRRHARPLPPATVAATCAAAAYPGATSLPVISPVRRSSGTPPPRAGTPSTSAASR